MNRKQFDRLLSRDQHCLHCGSVDDTLVPQHRSNRGFGGSKLRDVPSNLIVLCAVANGLCESDARFAAKARVLGWKLSRWDDPRSVPVFDLFSGVWLILGDDWSRFELHNYSKIELDGVG